MTYTYPVNYRRNQALFDISNVIKDIRIKAELTQKAFADMLFVSESTVQKWESGRNNPTIEMFAFILSIFGQELIISKDNISAADSSSANASVILAGKNMRDNDMSKPSWIEERFGSKTPSWADERWPDNSRDDEFWDETTLEASASNAESLARTQMSFEEIQTGKCYNGIIENVLLRDQSEPLYFCNINGLNVLCKADKALSTGETTTAEISNIDHSSKRAFGIA